MALIESYPIYAPARQKWAGALDASYTLDFGVDPTWIIPLSGMYQGLPVLAQSITIDNSSNGASVGYTAGATNGNILPFSIGSIECTKYNEITFNCLTAQKMKVDVLNYGVQYGFSNLASQVTQSDPFFSSVIGLYHFDGANGSLVTPDNATNGFGNMIMSNGASIDTSIFKFGISSAKFPTNVSSVNEGVSSNTATFKTNWTIEAFLKINSIDSANGSVKGLFFPTTADKAPNINLESIFPNKIFVGCGTSPTVNSIISPSAITPDGLFHHIAIVGIGSSVSIYIDGILQVNGTVAFTAFAADNLNINFNNGLSNCPAYNIDELRISNGPRYLTNFLPPSQPFFNM